MEKTFEEKYAEAKANVPALSPQHAHQYRQGNPDVVFIDPRDESDIKATTGIIPNALNVSLFDLKAIPDCDLPTDLTDRSRAIIASCQGGPMGALAAYALKQRGYKNVKFIDGGTQAWLDAGYPTDR